MVSTQALLVAGRSQHFVALRRLLEEQGTQVHWVSSLAAAGDALREPALPDIVFTDVELPDGDWTKILQLARKSLREIHVVVVSRLIDMTLYLEALQSGAEDFIVPPFEPSHLAHVVRSAARQSMEEARPLARHAAVA